MAVPKTLGIETEYGIAHRGVVDPNPVSASSLLINAYLATHGYKAEADSSLISWDFIDESPELDARGLHSADAMPPVVETHLINAVLANGARYYVDHAHPEMSTPECADPLQAVLYDRAGELITQQSMAAANQLLPADQELVVYKNNSDGKGSSYGTHENYLVSRETPFGQIVKHCLAHFITRQIFTGSGKVGAELPGQRTDEVHFQLTQRADFFEEEIGLETTLKRPIVNTRDEPHADPSKYRRLHVIVGDANLSQVATLLKLGTTGIVLAMIEDGAVGRGWEFKRPVVSLRHVSHDLSLSDPLPLADGSTITALEVQWELLRKAKAYCDDQGAERLGWQTTGDVLARWESVLAGLESEPMSLSSQLDWVAKYRLIDGYRERHDLAWSDPRLAALDIQYSDMRPQRGLAARVGLEQLVTDADALAATTQPPIDTRAYFRGRCIGQYPKELASANWDSLVFDIGTDMLRRVPMPEPRRGTKSHVGKLLDECSSAAELLRRLGN